MKKDRSSLLAGLSLVAALSIPGLLAAPMGCKKAPAPETQQTPTQTEETAPEKPSMELMQRLWDAWGTLDPEKAAPFYAKSPDLVFFDFAPLQARGWDAYARGAKELLASFTTMKAKVRDDVRVDVRGNYALAAGIVHLDVTFKDGMTESFNARWSAAWEWRDGEWLIVHEHISVPIHDGPPPEAQQQGEPSQGN